MDCPKCSAGKAFLRVLESRDQANYIRRRRLCTSCEHRFTTYEAALPPEADEAMQLIGGAKLVVVNRDGSPAIRRKGNNPFINQRHCSNCRNWERWGCAFDVPEAGGLFAQSCYLFKKRESGTRQIIEL